MAVKIRLARHGRKASPFYHIVAADSRSPRDGKFIEKIGTYRPTTNPASVEIKFDRALYWLEVGAEPTDTVRNILRDQGVLYMKHLQGGVKKGAFDEAALETKFQAWLEENRKKTESLVSKLSSAKQIAAKKRIELEIEKNKARETEIAKKNSELAAAAAASEAPAEVATEEEVVADAAEETAAE